MATGGVEPLDAMLGRVDGHERGAVFAAAQGAEAPELPRRLTGAAEGAVMPAVAIEPFDARPGSVRHEQPVPEEAEGAGLEEKRVAPGKAGAEVRPVQLGRRRRVRQDPAPVQTERAVEVVGPFGLAREGRQAGAEDAASEQGRPRPGTPQSHPQKAMQLPQHPSNAPSQGSQHTDVRRAAAAGTAMARLRATVSPRAQRRTVRARASFIVRSRSRGCGAATLPGASVEERHEAARPFTIVGAARRRDAPYR